MRLFLFLSTFGRIYWWSIWIWSFKYGFNFFDTHRTIPRVFVYFLVIFFVNCVFQEICPFHSNSFIIYLLLFLYMVLATCIFLLFFSGLIFLGVYQFLNLFSKSHLLLLLIFLSVCLLSISLTSALISFEFNMLEGFFSLVSWDGSLYPWYLAFLIYSLEVIYFLFSNALAAYHSIDMWNIYFHLVSIVISGIFWLLFCFWFLG